jgi:hypothetical protein
MISAKPGDKLAGLWVIGFNGEVEPQDTPARRAPVLANDQGVLVRLVPETSAERDGAYQLRVETGTRVGAEEALPGHGTRLERGPARLGHTLVLVGDAERSAAPRMRDLLSATAPASVTDFIDWLARGCPAPAPKGARHMGRLVAWYCSEVEAHALWTCIHEEAKRELFHAVAENHIQEMIAGSWWLSRAAFTDEDLYLAAAGLKRAGSPYAENMLRAMLEEPPGPKALQRGLENALKLLLECARPASREPASDNQPEPHAPRYPILSDSRDAVRKLGMIGVHG